MLKHRTLLISGTNRNTGKPETLVTRKDFPKEVSVMNVFEEVATSIREGNLFVSYDDKTDFLQMFDPKEYSAMNISIQEV